MEIEAKVASVLDSRRIALNAGAKQGVADGSDVTLWNVVEVTDPDTDEPLGSVRVDKLRLVVVDVQDNLSLATIKSEASRSSAIFFLGAAKRTRTGQPSNDENAITVNRGDEATIFVP